MTLVKMKPSPSSGVRSLSFTGSNSSTDSVLGNHYSIPHNSCFLVNGKERKLSNSYLRFQRRYSKHGTRDATFDTREGSVHMHLRGKPIQLFASSNDLKNSYSLNNGAAGALPGQDLKLEWVYGYRGKDARSNLYLLPTGELVYFIASVVVLFNPELNKQRHYLGHTEEVKCLAVHPNKILIATGQGTSGQDRKENKPHVRIWNSASLQTHSIIGLGDFERCVVCLSFSKDGSSYLVAVDEGTDHTMTIWDYSGGSSGGSLKIAEAKCSNKETVLAAEFHPIDAGLIVTCGKGHVNFWNLDDHANLVRKTGLFPDRDKPKYVTCLAFGSNGDVLTGDSNGQIFVWRRGYNAVTKALKKVHTGAIFAICVLKDGSIVSGGGKDGKLVHFDANYKKTDWETEILEDYGAIRTICQGKSNDRLIIGTTHNCILACDLSSIDISTVLAHGHDDEIKSLTSACHDLGRYLSLSHDRWVRFWDSDKHCVLWSFQTDETPNACCFSNDGHYLIIGMLDGRFVVIDVQSKVLVDEIHDLHDAICAISFSPNGGSLAVGTKNGTIHLYQVSNDGRKYNRIGRCTDDLGKKQRSASTGSSPINFVTQAHCTLALDWSNDSCYIRANTQEASITFWNATTCRQISNQASLRDVEWQTQNCLMTFQTLGIWPETVDGTDLTAGARNNASNLFVAGDDFGKIKLYKYPVIHPKAQHYTHGGHSAAISALTFGSDDAHLFSSGGKDSAIFQWKLI